MRKPLCALRYFICYCKVYKHPNGEFVTLITPEFFHTLVTLICTAKCTQLFGISVHILCTVGAC